MVSQLLGVSVHVSTCFQRPSHSPTVTQLIPDMPCESPASPRDYFNHFLG